MASVRGRPVQNFCVGTAFQPGKSTMVVATHLPSIRTTSRMTVQTHRRYSDAVGPHPFANSSSTTSFLTKTADSNFASPTATWYQLHTTGDDGTLTRIPSKKNNSTMVRNNVSARNGGLRLLSTRYHAQVKSIGPVVEQTCASWDM